MYDIGRDGKRRYGTYIGVVKKNDDPQTNGRCSVWIPEFGGDPDREENWYIISYASPFAGATSIKSVQKDSANMAGSQTAYGFWMQPPDLENHLLITFVNGDTSKGYWFACIYPTNMNHAVPGIPNNVSTDDSLTSQGIYPPVVEYNKKSNENPDQPHRPTFEPLHEGLSNQGLYPDAERGRSTSGARREAPSKTFGYSTPRGTSMIVDDNPDNEFIRMRTRGGTQVLIHETSGYVYINSKNGNSWIEVSDEGIDIYSKKSVSVRAAEDLNFKADRDIFIEADRGLFLRAGQTMTTESVKDTAMKAGTDFKIGSGSKFQCKAGADLNIDATGSITHLSPVSILNTAPIIANNGSPATPVQQPQVRSQGDRVDIQPPPTTTQSAQSANSVASTAQTAQAATQTVSTQTQAATQAVQNTQVQIPDGNGGTKAVSPSAGVTECNNAIQSLGSTAAQAQGYVSALANCQQVAQAQTSALTDLSGAFARIQTALQGLGQMAGQASSVASTLSSATALGTSIASSLAGAGGGSTGTTTGSGGGSAAVPFANSVPTQVPTQVSSVGGTLGGNLSGAATQVSGMINQITNVANAANNLVAQGIGIVNQASNLLTGLAGQAQNVATQATSAINTAKAAVSTVGNLANTLGGIAGDPSAAASAQAIQNVLANLTNSTTSATTAVSSMLSAAGTAQASTPQHTTKKTIVQRMPTHEPWPWHVKEGQQTPASTSTTDQDQQAADASDRPAQGVAAITAGGEQPTSSPATKTIQTGTGDAITQVAKYAGPMLQLGSSLVRGDVFSALKEAASVAGVDIGYLMAKAAEMGFNPDLTIAGTSGFMQVSPSVYSGIANKYGAQLGLGVNDVQDPRANALAGAIIARDNSSYMVQHGIEVGPTELTLAHAMGAPVATQFLANLSRDPTAEAYTTVPESFSRSHRSIFYNGSGGSARTAAEVYAMFDNSISGRATHYRDLVSQLEPVSSPQPFPPGTFA